MASTLDGLSQAHHERVLELLNEREGDQFEDQDEDEPDGDGDGDGDSPTGCMAPARRPWRRSSDTGKGRNGRVTSRIQDFFFFFSYGSESSRGAEKTIVLIFAIFFFISNLRFSIV